MHEYDPELIRQCAACLENLNRDHFSKSAWNRASITNKELGRCTDCTIDPRKECGQREREKREAREIAGRLNTGQTCRTRHTGNEQNPAQEQLLQKGRELLRAGCSSSPNRPVGSADSKNQRRRGGSAKKQRTAQRSKETTDRGSSANRQAIAGGWGNGDAAQTRDHAGSKPTMRDTHRAREEYRRSGTTRTHVHFGERGEGTRETTTTTDVSWGSGTAKKQVVPGGWGKSETTNPVQKQVIAEGWGKSETPVKKQAVAGGWGKSETPNPVQTTTTESPYAQRPLPKWAKPASTSHQHADSNSLPLQQGTHVSLESPPVTSNQKQPARPGFTYQGGQWKPSSESQIDDEGALVVPIPDLTHRALHDSAGFSIGEFLESLGEPFSSYDRDARLSLGSHMLSKWHGGHRLKKNVVRGTGENHSVFQANAYYLAELPRMCEVVGQFKQSQSSLFNPGGKLSAMCEQSLQAAVQCSWPSCDGATFQTVGQLVSHLWEAHQGKAFTAKVVQEWSSELNFAASRQQQVLENAGKCRQIAELGNQLAAKWQVVEWDNRGWY